MEAVELFVTVMYGKANDRTGLIRTKEWQFGSETAVLGPFTYKSIAAANMVAASSFVQFGCGFCVKCRSSPGT